MKKLPNVTYLTIMGREKPVDKENHELVNRIVKLASNWFEFGSVKLLSAQDKNQCVLDEKIEFVKIDPMQAVDYNRFCVEDLHKYVDTEYVILFQTDGFILCGENWDDKFLDYDYIGSPWPFVFGDNKYYRIEDFGTKYPEHFECHHLCGNGGFSLRSKKFLELSSKLKYNPQTPVVSYDFNPEDVFLCLDNYQYFIENGCKFGEGEVGFKFSYEDDMYILEKGQFKTQPLHPLASLGFHGVDQTPGALSILIKRLLYNTK